MIHFRCHKCHRMVRIAETFAGKTVRCPNCQAFCQVPEAENENEPSSAAGSGHAAPQEHHDWLLKTPEGEVFGPVSKTELDSWCAEGRIAAEAHIANRREKKWRPATEYYPQLKGETAPAAESQPVTPPPPPAPTEEPVAAEVSPLSIKVDPATTGLHRATARKQLTFLQVCLGIFDIQFKIYLTPYLIRAYWVLVLVVVSLLFVLGTISILVPESLFGGSSVGPSYDFSRPPTVREEPSKVGRAVAKITSRIIAWLSLVIFLVQVLVAVRIVLEFLIVMFDISEQTHRIEALLQQRADSS